MTIGELIGFCGLSIFGGLLGSATASAHRLAGSHFLKLLLSLVALVLTLAVLIMGVSFLGYGLPLAGVLMHEDARLDLANAGDLMIYLRWLGSYLTTVLGYFTLVAYFVGMALCALLQRSRRLRQLRPAPNAG